TLTNITLADERMEFMYLATGTSVLTSGITSADLVTRAAVVVRDGSAILPSLLSEQISRRNSPLPETGRSASADLAKHCLTMKTICISIKTKEINSVYRHSFSMRTFVRMRKRCGRIWQMTRLKCSKDPASKM